MKILIVEDDRALNDGIALSLRGEENVQAFSLAQARGLFDESIDLIILDVNLPDGSGLDYCKEIREKSKVAIIFLTANDMETDIVTGLEIGADDYITKPFSLMVLRARVNAVSRRKPGQAVSEQESGQPEETLSGSLQRDAMQPGTNCFRQEGFFFDFESMRFTVEGVAVELSKTEQKLLKLLVSNRGITLSRNMLIDRIWSDGAEFVEENALSVTMNRLRSKLPGVPVKTVYGIGYVWEKCESII